MRPALCKVYIMPTPLLAKLEPSAVAALVFVGAVSFMLLMRSQRYFRRQRPEPLPSQRAKQAIPAASRPPADVERWQVDMHDLARELSAQLDSKLSALQYLVNLADERIAQLQSLTAQSSTSPGVARKASTDATQAEPLAHSASITLPTKHEARAAEIYALADAGESSQAIAAIVGAPIGEVELVLGLRSAR